MCAPEHFGVHYVINPWMQGQRGKTDPSLAERQWRHLEQVLSQYVALTYVTPEPGLPDLVFTANAGLVFKNKAIVSRFASKERQGEEPYFRAWFEKRGFEIIEWPTDTSFEGAGDALFDRGQDILWVGYGFRSDAMTPSLLQKTLDYRTLALHLIDPRFYHLDTCFCPLEGGILMYFPPAFDKASQDLIAQTIPTEKRIALDEEDATRFACNAVDLNRHIFLNGASSALQNRLRELGFTPVVTELSEFMKAGGAAKCLTLKLYEP